MKVNLFTFFREQLGRWKKENSARSHDYIQGGVVAIRELGDKLTARKDEVDTDKLATQLAESEKENRYVQERNKALNQQVRDITAQYEKLQREHEIQRLEIQGLKKSPAAVAKALAPVVIAPTKGQNKKTAELLAENGSLRHRISVLEGLLVAEGKPTANPSNEAEVLRGTLKGVQLQLDQYRGNVRVGTHIFKPRHFIKRLQDMLAWEHLPLAIRLLFVARHAHSALCVLDGVEPDEWVDKPDLSQYQKPELAECSPA